MYAYVHQKNITVLSSYDPAHPDWVRDNAFFRKKPDDVCKKPIVLPRQAPDKHRETLRGERDEMRFPQVKEDLAIFDIELSAAEMSALDKVTEGKRTCSDCYTAECQARESGGTLCPRYKKMTVLPRRARDKHRKNSLRAAFVAGLRPGADQGRLPRRSAPRRLHLGAQQPERH